MILVPPVVMLIYATFITYVYDTTQRIPLHIWNNFVGFALQIFAFVILFLTPISSYIHIVIILIFIDFVTGSYASYTEGEKFNARKMRNTIHKFIFYSIAIIVAYLLQYIAKDGTEMARVIAFYIASIEVKSNFENIGRVTKSDFGNKLWGTIRANINKYMDKSKKS